MAPRRKRHRDSAKETALAKPTHWRLQHGDFSEPMRIPDPETGTPVTVRRAPGAQPAPSDPDTPLEAFQAAAGWPPASGRYHPCGEGLTPLSARPRANGAHVVPRPFRMLSTQPRRWISNPSLQPRDHRSRRLRSAIAPPVDRPTAPADLARKPRARDARSPQH
jgi:hypothetical protein